MHSLNVIKTALRKLDLTLKVPASNHKNQFTVLFVTKGTFSYIKRLTFTDITYNIKMIIKGMVNQKEPWSIEILPTLQPNVWLLGRKNIEEKKRKRTLFSS